jgi:S-adenosylmethionine hydrolase
LSGLELIEISFWDSFGNVIKNILKKEVEKKRNILKLCEVFRHPGENILTI